MTCRNIIRCKIVNSVCHSKATRMSHTVFHTVMAVMYRCNSTIFKYDPGFRSEVSTIRTNETSVYVKN